MHLCAFCVFTGVGVSVHAKARGLQQVCLPAYFLGQRLSLNRRFSNLVRQAGQPGPELCLCLPSTGVTGVHHCTWLFLWVSGFPIARVMMVWLAFYQLNHPPTLHPPPPLKIEEEKGPSVCLSQTKQERGGGTEWLRMRSRCPVLSSGPF